MGMTSNNLCNSCTNIGCVCQSGIVRTKCDFYMPPHIEPDNCGNYIVMQQLAIEAIPKADYEARLKADMVAMLEQLDSEIQELIAFMDDGEETNGMKRADNLVKDKINALKQSIWQDNCNVKKE